MSPHPRGWSPDQVTALLQKVELFAGLPDEDLRSIAEIVEGETQPAGHVLFEEGDPGDAFYIVFEGAVEITKERADGSSEKLAVRRAGEAFGEMALLNDAPRSATATVVQDSRLMKLSREDLRTLLGGDTLALRMMRTLSEALRALGVRFASTEALADRGSSHHDEAMAMSRVMQAGLLPSIAPKVEGFDLAAGTTTEESGRGGSVWDWTHLADGRVALLTLDVRQDGFPPAHHLGVVRAVTRAVAPEASSVRELLARANDAIADARVEGLEQFVEAGVLVASDGRLEWGSAGRVPGGVIRRAGTFDTFGAHGPPLGMMKGFRFASQELEVGVGDTAFVLSHAPQGLFMGAADLLAQLHGKPAGEVVTTLHRAIRKAQGEDRTETSVLYARKS